MNKYQKALSELKHSDIKLHVYNEQDNIIEEHQPTIYDFYHDEIFVLKELVEKATPKKPLDVQEPVLKWGLCPNCKGELNMFHGRPNRVLLNEKYCRDCGQAIDWSDEES